MYGTQKIVCRWLIYFLLVLHSLASAEPLFSQVINPAEFPREPSTRHVVGVRGLGPSVLRVIVDGRIVHNGDWGVDEQHEWSGQQIIVWTSNAGSIELAVDGQSSEVLRHTQAMFGFGWPEPAARIKPTLSSNQRQEDATLSSGGDAVFPPTFHIVQPGETLSAIAVRYDMEMDRLITANNIADPDWISIGAALAIPGSDGSLPDATLLTTATLNDAVFLPPRGSVVERMTAATRKARITSPFRKTTWVTYYGRPNVPIMGILGEHDVNTLAELLRVQADAYDEANGETLTVTPAFHLVYGMATKAVGDGSHLAFLDDATVEEYIAKAEEEGFAVILDIQIGALTPVESIAWGLPWLTYENVHLAIDPEFAKVYPGQAWPGLPIGYVTAQQVNEVQATIQTYMAENKIQGPRILLVHQFQDSMIVNKANLDWSYRQIELTLSVDGWGPPFGKISKYNAFIDSTTKFSAFKLFYGWDSPLMSERQALGVDPYGEGVHIEVTPNLIIYQ